jgi:hypothetical protein
LVFEKNALLFAENGQKSQKIVIITSTPGFPDGINFQTKFPSWVILEGLAMEDIDIFNGHLMYFMSIW